MSDLITAATAAVPREHYTDHHSMGSVPQSTALSAIVRDLERAGIEPGMIVLEIGTGTGYTGALLAEMTGPSGRVVSIDIDPALTERAAKLHAERGVPNLTVVTDDGHHGAPNHAPFDRVIGWATPTFIPQTWVTQTRRGGRICTPVYIAPVARTVGHVAVTINDEGEPADPVLGAAVYVDMGSEVNTMLGMPLFHVDAQDGDEQAWVSVAWRSWDGSNPAAALAILRHPDFTEVHLFSADGAEQAALWRDFRAFCVAHDNGPRSNLTAFGTGAPDWDAAIGFSSSRNAAALTVDGRLLGNRADSPAVAKVRKFLTDWQQAGRPGLEQFQAQLTSQPRGWTVNATAGVPTAPELTAA